MTSRSTSHNWAWGAALVAALLAPLVLSNDFILHMMTLWAIYSLLALSLNIIIGYLGELSFGHAAFFGIGAYTSALLVMNLGLPVWWGPVLALLPMTVAATNTGPHHQRAVDGRRSSRLGEPGVG